MGAGRAVGPGARLREPLVRSLRRRRSVVTMSSVRVDVWSDVACPWCWVGKRNLEAAAREAGLELDVRWHAFELDASAPRTHDPSIPYVDRLARKYGASPAQAQQMVDRMTGVGEGVGIDFRFDRARPVNTFDAHRLLAWAAQSGKQDALKERLFKAYMHEGKLLTDRDVLVDLAADAGLDPEHATAVLSGEDFAREVREDEAAAAELGVTGVPFFVVDGRFAIPGAQPPDAIVRVLARAQEEAEAVEPETAAGEVCGPDGCAVPS